MLKSFIHQKLLWNVMLVVGVGLLACLPDRPNQGQLMIDGDSRLTVQEAWNVDSQEQWQTSTLNFEGLELAAGMASPFRNEATIRSVIKRFDQATQAHRITVRQSDAWLNWSPVENIGPSNLGDAPVMLSIGPGNYWMFGRYRKPDKKNPDTATFEPQPATLDGFDIPLQTTVFPNQYNATGGLKKGLGGYHAWQSKDMVNWVHHGPITESKGKWMTSAEFADGKAYFYYDFPNDQDPHVYVDADLFDGQPGKDHGLAYADPSHGSDSGIIRGLDGQFHLILEDWSPINARQHSWDSPLAAHAVSPNGVDQFRAIVPPPVDHRTKATGETATYQHGMWVKESPERFKTNVAEYQVHEPEQNAYGDWAPICVGGQYYLFCDYDPADRKQLSVGWFTAGDIDQPFQWCGEIGEGHPDPDIMFAEGKFYLATQQKTDYVSTGPWVDGVQVRVGVDTDNDRTIDQWTKWTRIAESYDHIPGFSKQISRSPATLDLSTLPAGFGFQFEIRLKGKVSNKLKPILDAVQVTFD